MKISGTTLIEVLVSMLLLSLILFGLDAMEFTSLQKSKINYFYNMAVMQINNMTERIASIKSEDELASHLSAWNEENKIVLPKGIGTVIGEYPHYQITIYWGDTLKQCEHLTIGESGCIKINLE